jgi:hypothetical protein
MDDHYSDRWAVAMGRAKKPSRPSPSPPEAADVTGVSRVTLPEPPQTELVLSVANIALMPSRHLGRDSFDLRISSTKGHVTRFTLCPEDPLARAKLAGIQAALDATSQGEGDWLEAKPER